MTVRSTAEPYAAAGRVLAAGLADDDSAFDPGTAIWTASVAGDLHERYVLAAVPGAGGFMDKLAAQLAGAPAETVQLAAELLYLHLLASKDIGAAAKLQLVSTVLDLGATSASVPPDLVEALAHGFARTGVAFQTLRDRQLAWLVRLVVDWKGLQPAERTEALRDPWAFRAAVDNVPVASAYSQRNALLHLAFPDTFEAIVSRRHKAAIVRAFAAEIEVSGDDDRDLLAIREELESHTGERVNFYSSDLVGRWRKTVIPDPEYRGWLVRGAKVHGVNLVSEWLRDGYCSIAFPELPELDAGMTKGQFDAALTEAIPELSAAQRRVRVGELDRFYNTMQAGDVVVTVDGPDFYVGTVTGAPAWEETPARLSSRRRPVHWFNADHPVQRAVLSESARDRLSGQLTVSSLKADAAEFMSHVEVDVSGERPDGSDPIPEPPDEVDLPAPTASLARELLVDLPWLDETIDLLREKKQLVLYGPPGTGKTYLAQKVAQFLAEQTGGEHRLVQFHPSYSYEDFFEGFRPQEGSAAGTIAFGLEPGPLKTLVQRAVENPASVYVLVIDEINRANLAKVFGELYFLLEYRDHAVQLQYSPNEDFRLPGNVYFVGTMNTADRSIALVDAAMRRRFAWQRLFPGEAPVAGMFRQWLERHGMPEDRADLLDALNARIRDPNAAIGPAYLMNQRIGTEEGLARVWKHHIVPLLEERHIDEDLDVAEHYGLPSLRSGLPATSRQQPLADTLAEETGEPVR